MVRVAAYVDGFNLYCPPHPQMPHKLLCGKCWKDTAGQPISDCTPTLCLGCCI